MRVAIVGAGISGLGAALLLAHEGHEVVVLERDATPLPLSPDEAFGWNRRGAPQVRHSHAFLARGRNLIRDRLPEVRCALLDAGATEVGWSDMIPDTIVDRSPRAGDEDLVMLACRRTTFEWVLRRAALGTDRVEIRDGTVVTGLRVREAASVPQVDGVCTDSGEVAADLVVDATGRPSHLIEMLGSLGVTLRETKSASGIVYLSRFYRLVDGVGEPSTLPFNGADLGYLKYAVFRGDNRTFSVTFAYDTDDRAISCLREPGRFDAAVRAIPNIWMWVNPETSHAISDVHYMGGLINRVRHFVRDGRPLVGGLVAVGDASVCTNPLYGRGCSLGLVHAGLLADVLRDHPDDVAVAFDEATRTELVPWYDASVAQDEVNMKVARDEPLSEFDTYIRSIVNEGIFPAARTDATVSRAWVRAFNLLTQPYALMTDPDVMRLVLEVWEERADREPEPLQGPGRDEFCAAVG